MATPATEARRLVFAGLFRLLAPAPGRLEFAARLALLCVVTTLVVEIYQTPEPALTAYVAFFMIKPDRVESVIFSIAFMVLMTLIVGSVILITMVVIDQPAWRVATMAVISFCLLFAGSSSKLRPVGGIIALIAAYALDLLGSVPFGELATRALLYAWLFIGIPASLSIVVNMAIGPAPCRLAERALGRRLALAAEMLRAPEPHVRDEFAEVLSEGVGEIQTWVRLAGVEQTSKAEDVAALRQATDSMIPLMLLVDMVDRDSDCALPNATRARLADTLDEMASIFDRGFYPLDIAFHDDEVPEPLAPVAEAILAEFKQVLDHFAEAAPPAPSKKSPAQKGKGGFFLPDAFTNPAHVQYALKTTAAAMFCYFVYELLDWPGIHTCLITCYIVALTTAAETVEKLSLRILGCLVGAAAGLAAIVFVMPGVTSIGGLMIVVFLAALASGWVAGGSPRISYAGFQMGFAFFLCVSQGSAPAFDLAVARDRVVGILFGNVVVYLLFTSVSPVSVARRIDPAIASLLHKLGAMMAAASRRERYALASEALSAKAAIEQDLELVRYEPSMIRPGEAWIEARRQAMREIAGLGRSMLLRAGQYPAAAGDIWSRLDALAHRFGDATRPSAPGIEVDALSSVAKPQAEVWLDRQILARLERVEQALSSRPAEADAGQHALA